MRSDVFSASFSDSYRSRKDRNSVILLGALAGDIIGSPFEHYTHKSTDFELFTPRCRFTDDTVLTMAVAQAILDGIDYGEALRTWGRRYPHSGYGGAFREWLKYNNARPYNSYGNGSAMRVSPVGWAFTDLEFALSEAERSAAPTHNHPEGIKGAQVVALAILLARSGAGKEAIRGEVERRFGYDLQRTVEAVRPGYVWDVTCQGSVPEAVIAFLDADDFEGTVRNAVSFGGDSDTMAAIAGSIAEAFYGGVPPEIAAEVKSRVTGEMWQVVERFSESFGAAQIK